MSPKLRLYTQPDPPVPKNLRPPKPPPELPPIGKRYADVLAGLAQAETQILRDQWLKWARQFSFDDQQRAEIEQAYAAPLLVRPPSPATITSVDQSHFHAGKATVAEVIDWYASNNPTPSTCDKAEKERTRLYRLFVSEYGERTCAECRPHDALAFINKFGLNHSAWTRKRWNSTLQRPFNVAVQLGLISRNPLRGLTFPEGDNGRDWTDLEYRAILRNAGPPMKRFIVMIRFSGMRPGEIRGLQWRHVKIEGNAIVLEEHKTVYKTKQSRRIPLNHVLVKLLLWIRANSPPNSKCIFLNSYGNPWSCKGLNDNLQAVRRRANLDKDVRLHGGRHTFATCAIMNGVDVGTLAQILGHARIEMTQRYMHLAGKTDHLNEAMEQAIATQKKKSAPTKGKPSKGESP